MIYKFLFPSNPNSTGASLFLLILRVFFGLLLMNHGIQKWSNFQELSAAFPDPLGVGSPLSLGLAIFGELVCDTTTAQPAKFSNPSSRARNVFTSISFVGSSSNSTLASSFNAKAKCKRLRSPPDNTPHFFS